MLLRDEIRSGSKLGERIRETVESGHLVSDDLVDREVFNRIGNMESFLLDGYPRNLNQARHLDTFLNDAGRPLDGAVFIDVPDDEVMRRLTGRLVCDCPEVNPSSGDFREGDICPVCGSRFRRRSDDSRDVVENRLHHYHRLTGHLEGYYSRRLLRVNGMGTIDQVYNRIVEALEEWA
jgi:adenylate kinase